MESSEWHPGSWKILTPWGCDLSYLPTTVSKPAIMLGNQGNQGNHSDLAVTGRGEGNEQDTERYISLPVTTKSDQKPPVHKLAHKTSTNSSPLIRKNCRKQGSWEDQGNIKSRQRKKGHLLYLLERYLKFGHFIEKYFCGVNFNPLFLCNYEY